MFSTLACRNGFVDILRWSGGKCACFLCAVRVRICHTLLMVTELQYVLYTDGL